MNWNKISQCLFSLRIELSVRKSTQLQFLGYSLKKFRQCEKDSPFLSRKTVSKGHLIFIFVSSFLRSLAMAFSSSVSLLSLM